MRTFCASEWAKNDAEALAVRAVGRQSPPTDQTDPVAHYRAYAWWLEHADPAVVANALICLIHQTNYLLDQQISALERDFVQGGGYSEQLGMARLAARQGQRRDQPAAPTCPLCGKLMILRTARQGVRAGSQFWGCSGFPECKGTREIDRSDQSDRSDPTDERRKPLNQSTAS
jgi:restriction system protein